MKPSSVLILTHIDQKTNQVLLPHIEWLKKTNPNVDYHIIVGEDSVHGKKYNWKNGDQPLIKWYQCNHTKINSQVIAIVEYDTLIGCELPDLPDHLDLAGKQMFVENISVRNKWIRKRMSDPSWTNDNWFWWPEIPLLELTDNQKAIGLISFGFYLVRKWVLDVVCDTKWTHLFSKSIQNELRFPTIASLCGATIGTIDLPFVNFDNTIVGDKPGIYHGVNNPFYGEFHSVTNNYTAV